MEPDTAQVTETIRPDEAGLVRRASAGDAEAFDAIAAEHLPEAFRSASVILGNEAEAADATQAALIAIWRELPRLRDAERFDEWFQQILDHECRTRPARETRDGDVGPIEDDARLAPPPPAWLLPSVAQAVRATPQAQGARTKVGWLPRRRNERLVLVAAAAILPVALVLGVLVAGGMRIGPPNPSEPAVVDGASPSVIGSLGTQPSASVAADASAGPRTPAPPLGVVARQWSLPTGWRYEFDCDDDGSGCGLSLYDAAGRLQDGWPVVVKGDCQGSPVAVGPDESTFVACTLERRTVVYGLDRRGKALPGWPVSLRGTVASSTWNDFASAYGAPSIVVGPDATVYVATHPAGDRGFAINALAPDASTRAGWPVDLDGNAGGFLVAPNGDLAAWWYEGAQAEMQLDASRTEFTQIAPDGQVRSGWPRGSVGAASGPILWEDGSLFYVSASGKVWGHDRGGEIINGWPYQLASPVAPSFRADGTLMFIEDSRVTVLDRRGKAVPGWPYRAKGTFTGPPCDTGGFSLPLAAQADDGTLYLATWDGERAAVVGLGTDGAAPDGWPYRVPAGWRVAYLSFDPASALKADLIGDDCDGLVQPSIGLDAHGKLVGAAPPTSLRLVYEAMRLDGLRTTSGKGSFVQGAQIDFDFALVNRASGDITLPHVESEAGSWYAAGMLQTWLEPLVPGPPLWYCLPNPSQGNERYATGGWIVVSADPVTIAAGETMPPLLDASLPPQTTACLPPGEYRYRIEYKRYGVQANDVMDEDKPIDKATLDFTITARAPGVTPSPSPTPLQPAPAPTPPPAAASPS